MLDGETTPVSVIYGVAWDAFLLVERYVLEYDCGSIDSSMVKNEFTSFHQSPAGV